MVLELRDKLPAPAGAAEVSAAQASPVEEDVISALVNLGYQRATAEKALRSIPLNAKSARVGHPLRVLRFCFARRWGRCRSEDARRYLRLAEALLVKLLSLRVTGRDVLLEIHRWRIVRSVCSDRSSDLCLVVAVLLTAPRLVDEDQNKVLKKPPYAASERAAESAHKASRLPICMPTRCCGDGIFCSAAPTDTWIFPGWRRGTSHCRCFPCLPRARMD